MPIELVNKYNSTLKFLHELARREQKNIYVQPAKARYDHLFSFVKKGTMGPMHVAVIQYGEEWDGNFSKTLITGDNVFITIGNGTHKYTYQGHNSYGIIIKRITGLHIIPWEIVEDIYYIKPPSVFDVKSYDNQ